MNPLHDVEAETKTPEVVNAIIEIPPGSKTKFELDKESGLLRVDRVLYSSVHYPHAYGFIPRTHCDDGDPLDILVLGQAEVYPLCLMHARPLGCMRMIDQGKLDDKIIAVHEDDPVWNHYRELSELPPHLIQEVHNFFETYKKLEAKTVKVEGFIGRAEAYGIICEAIKLYQKEFAAK
jgi:inorganic pyrophosphatase